MRIIIVHFIVVYVNYPPSQAKATLVPKLQEQCSAFITRRTETPRQRGRQQRESCLTLYVKGIMYSNYQLNRCVIYKILCKLSVVPKKKQVKCVKVMYKLST